jgi:membrane associated rhomboid family serine protease
MVVITPILIAINVLVYFLTQDPVSHVRYGLNAYFFQGAWWQPLTSMFMHANLSHLAMNMVVLFQFGYLLEKELNAHLKYLFIYLVGGVVTSLLTIAFMRYAGFDHNVVGASGAISVLFGWFAKKDPHLRGGLIVALLIISFVPLLMGVPIAWYAHLIGFGLGWLLGYAI